MPKFKILAYLPPYGQPPVQFAAHFHMFHEGFVVEFYPENGEKWVGNFEQGSGGILGYSVVLEHPNGKHLIVISSGQAYVVDPETRGLVSEFGGQIEYAARLTDLQEIIFGNGLWFIAVGPEGLRWETRQLSWDGMRSIDLTGTTLTGESYSPLSDSWTSFSVDLRNGSATGGSYFEKKVDK